jgi:hypothetical protein
VRVVVAVALMQVEPQDWAVREAVVMLEAQAQATLTKRVLTEEQTLAVAGVEHIVRRMSQRLLQKAVTAVQA